jgi:HK97 family phage portal protein
MMSESFNRLPRGLSIHRTMPLVTRRPMKPYAKSAQDDPRSSGGWDVLGGMPSWKSATGIWQKHFEPELESMYATQVVVYGCVKKICLSASEAPLCIGYEGDDGWEDVEHPLEKILKHPNPYMSYAEFIWHVLSHKLLTGRTYIWKWRNGYGNIGELWPMPTSMVKEVRDASGRIFGYKLWQGSAKDWMSIPREDMFVASYPDPANIMGGLGPLQAAVREVQTDGERQDYFVEMLTNSRTPGMILYQPDQWSAEQKDEVRATVLDGLGRGRRGKPLFMEGEGAKLEQIVPLKDLDWPGLTTLSETRICSAFGVPPIIIGLRAGLESGTYSNYAQALQSFYQGTMVPEWAMLDGAFTRGLLRDEGDDTLEVSHDISNVRGLQEDEDKRATRAAQLFSGGIVSRNEARKIVGLEPLEVAEGGDDIILPMSMIPIGGATGESDEPLTDDGTGTQNDDETTRATVKVAEFKSPPKKGLTDGEQ